MNNLYKYRIERIKEYLDSLGYDLAPLGVKGKALHKKDAFVFVDIISDSNVAILGGDVYCLKPNGNIVLTYDNWFCNRGIDEEYSVYVKRSIDVTKRYLQGYNNAFFDMNNILFDFVLDAELET